MRVYKCQCPQQALRTDRLQAVQGLFVTGDVNVFSIHVQKPRGQMIPPWPNRRGSSHSPVGYSRRLWIGSRPRVLLSIWSNGSVKAKNVASHKATAPTGRGCSVRTHVNTSCTCHQITSYRDTIWITGHLLMLQVERG